MKTAFFCLFFLAFLAFSVSAYEDYVVNAPIDIVVSFYNDSGSGLIPVTVQACNASVFRFNNETLMVNLTAMSPNPPTALHNYTWTPNADGVYGVDVECWLGSELATYYRQIEVLNSSVLNATYTLSFETNATAHTILSEMRANFTSVLAYLQAINLTTNTTILNYLQSINYSTNTTIPVYLSSINYTTNTTLYGLLTALNYSANTTLLNYLASINLTTNTSLAYLVSINYTTNTTILGYLIGLNYSTNVSNATILGYLVEINATAHEINTTTHEINATVFGLNSTAWAIWGLLNYYLTPAATFPLDGATVFTGNTFVYGRCDSNSTITGATAWVNYPNGSIYAGFPNTTTFATVFSIQASFPTPGAWSWFVECNAAHVASANSTSRALNAEDRPPLGSGPGPQPSPSPSPSPLPVGPVVASDRILAFLVILAVFLALYWWNSRDKGTVTIS